MILVGCSRLNLKWATFAIDVNRREFETTNDVICIQWVFRLITIVWQYMKKSSQTQTNKYLRCASSCPVAGRALAVAARAETAAEKVSHGH